MFKGWTPTKKEQLFLNKNSVQKNREWHLNGEKVKDDKVLALGRSDYYISFIETLTKKLGKKVFQSDFMTWDNNKSPWENLQYYIDTASEIHFSLRGVDINSLKNAIKSSGFIPYMTSREIRYIYHNPAALKKTIWYVESDEIEQFIKNKGIKRIGRYKSKSSGENEKIIMDSGYRIYNIKNDYTPEIDKRLATMRDKFMKEIDKDDVRLQELLVVEKNINEIIEEVL